MKTIIAVAVGLLWWCGAAFADGNAEVRDFIARYDRAYAERDEATIKALVADDYRVVVKGKIKDFPTAFAEFTDPARGEEPTQLTSMVDRIHVAGDLAVAVGTIQWTEGAKSGDEYFTLVLRRDGGVWRAVEEHISEVEKDDKS